jgi:hypothetical protein
VGMGCTSMRRVIVEQLKQGWGDRFGQEGDDLCQWAGRV